MENLIEYAKLLYNIQDTGESYLFKYRIHKTENSHLCNSQTTFIVTNIVNQFTLISKNGILTPYDIVILKRSLEKLLEFSKFNSLNSLRLSPNKKGFTLYNYDNKIKSLVLFQKVVLISTTSKFWIGIYKFLKRFKNT